MAVFVALWIKLMFRKYKYNFFEIPVLLCFVMGMAMLILAVFGIFEHFLNLPIMKYGSMIFIIYLSWVIADFFELKTVNVIKALFSYVIGTMTFILIAFVTGAFLDKFF